MGKRAMIYFNAKAAHQLKARSGLCFDHPYVDRVEINGKSIEKKCHQIGWPICVLSWKSVQQCWQKYFSVHPYKCNPNPPLPASQSKQSEGRVQTLPLDVFHTTWSGQDFVVKKAPLGKLRLQ